MKSTLHLFALLFFLTLPNFGYSQSQWQPTPPPQEPEEEVLNESFFGPLRRTCANALNSILPIDLTGFTEEQKKIILNNLLDKSELRFAKEQKVDQKTFRILFKETPTPGKYYRGLQIPVSALKRILENGMPYLDWRRPHEGLYITDNFYMAYAHAMLPDHGTYSSKFIGVILELGDGQRTVGGLAGQKIRVRDIPASYITGVKIVNRDYLLGTSRKLLFAFPKH